MNLLAARLAELIAQLKDLRQQLRAAIFESVRAAVSRLAGDAVDRLWRPAPPSRPAYLPTGRGDDAWREGYEDDEPGDAREPRDGTLGSVLRAGLGWWFLYRHSLLRIATFGVLGCVTSALVGGSRIAPAEVVDLALQAFDTLIDR